MPKKSKKEKQAPNFIVFLVEGESDQIALENPLSELIFDKHPDYEVRFLTQQRLVDRRTGVELDDDENACGDDGADEDATEEIVIEEYETGGDITSSSFVTPKNIVIKIENRFFKPAIRSEGLYAKRIAKIIHIVDLDGTFIPPDCVVSYSPERANAEKPYYDEEHGVIETSNVDDIRERNERKKENINYLIALTSEGIKIRSSTIPYEIYFFSSNLDHFIHHDANVETGKRALADTFLRKIGFDTAAFCSFFLDDTGALGHLGFHESWDEVKKGSNSVRRFTNIDCLIKRLMEEGN